MKVRLYIIIVLLCGFASLQAQGEINISAEGSIDQMMERWSQINRSKQYLDGYRIQLVATTDRQKVEREKQRFENLYPGVFVDWTHVVPYYRLRAGAFVTKLEATQMLYKIKQDYNSAYMVKDNQIQPHEVLN